jgi:hypothetical protein
VIRLVRLHAEGDVAPPGLDELAAGGELDLLQIDYQRPRLAPLVGHEPELPQRATAFNDALRSVAKTIFLEPQLRVVTSAGWCSSYSGAESASAVLIEAGCPDVPVAAVRGSNLLPIIDDLVAGGVKLDNIDTGAPWRTLKAPVLAADLEFGAGPFATALAEGARVIVAGYYDGAAPVLAAAAHQFHWGWKELDHLSCAAAAARAALWPHRHACDWLSSLGKLPAGNSHPRIELHPEGQFTVDIAHKCEASDADRLRQWLQTGKPRHTTHDHADVRWDASRADVSPTGPTQFRVAGVTGAQAENVWRLEILYQTGYIAEAMIEFSPSADPSLRQQIAEAFRTHFVDRDDERSLVTVQELAPADGAATASWVHMVCRSKRQTQCADFVEHLVRLAAANPHLVRLTAGRPTIQAECACWPAHVPRSAIDVAVDTRPAKEWQ